MPDRHRLDEQVAIVTGAAQGIGQGIALVLAEAGAKIVIGDIQNSSDTVQEIRDSGGQATSMIADVSKPDDDRALVDLALSEYGRLDILVNLGIGTPRDVGDAILYLVSPAARWVSGTGLHITGGTQRGSSVL